MTVVVFAIVAVVQGVLGVPINGLVDIDDLVTSVWWWGRVVLILVIRLQNVLRCGLLGCWCSAIVVVIFAILWWNASVSWVPWATSVVLRRHAPETRIGWRWVAISVNPGIGSRLRVCEVAPGGRTLSAKLSKCESGEI